MAYKKHEKPTVTTRTVAMKIAEGFEKEGWKIVGPEGGSQLNALRPLLRYLVKQGVVVHDSAGFNLKGMRGMRRTPKTYEELMKEQSD